VLEIEVKKSSRKFATNSCCQIHLVSLQHVVDVPAVPVYLSPEHKTH